MLNPKHGVNIQIRIPEIKTDFIILERKLKKEIGELTIPRMVISVPRYEEMSSGRAIYKDTSFILSRKNFPSNSWIELIIMRYNKIPLKKYDLKKVAVDFELNDDRRKIYNKLFFIETEQLTFLLKSNTKIVNPNVYMMVNISTCFLVWTYREGEVMCNWYNCTYCGSTFDDFMLSKT